MHTDLMLLLFSIFLNYLVCGLDNWKTGMHLAVGLEIFMFSAASMLVVVPTLSPVLQVKVVYHQEKSDIGMKLATLIFI
jgi:hypothetical protein